MSGLPPFQIVGTAGTLSVAVGVQGTTAPLRGGQLYLVQISDDSAQSLPLDASVLIATASTEAAYPFVNNTTPMLTAAEVTTSGVEGPGQLSFLVSIPTDHSFIVFKNLSAAKTARIRYVRVKLIK